mgnify:CR=1 FL=1
MIDYKYCVWWSSLTFQFIISKKKKIREKLDFWHFFIIQILSDYIIFLNIMNIMSLQWKESERENSSNLLPVMGNHF